MLPFAGPVQNLHLRPPSMNPDPLIVTDVPPVVGPADGVGRSSNLGSS